MSRAGAWVESQVFTRHWVPHGNGIWKFGAAWAGVEVATRPEPASRAAAMTPIALLLTVLARITVLLRSSCSRMSRGSPVAEDEPAADVVQVETAGRVPDLGGGVAVEPGVVGEGAVGALVGHHDVGLAVPVHVTRSHPVADIGQREGAGVVVA